MSGRGGKGTSLTHEQLQALGCIGKDMPAVTSVVPPTFPQLMSKPVRKDISAAQEYKILWKDAFLNYMRDSSYYTVSTAEKTQSSAYSAQLEYKSKAEIPWTLMPKELAPSWRKRKHQKTSNADESKKIKDGNITVHLEKLAEKDHSDDETDAAKKKVESDDEIEEPQEEDEEMDDENDYGENYFDNGEAYNEEDDNMDDGPIY